MSNENIELMGNPAMKKFNVNLQGATYLGDPLAPDDDYHMRIDIILKGVTNRGNTLLGRRLTKCIFKNRFPDARQVNLARIKNEQDTSLYGATVFSLTAYHSHIPIDKFLSFIQEVQTTIYNLCQYDKPLISEVQVMSLTPDNRHLKVTLPYLRLWQVSTISFDVRREPFVDNEIRYYSMSPIVNISLNRIGENKVESFPMIDGSYVDHCRIFIES